MELSWDACLLLTATAPTPPGRRTPSTAAAQDIHTRLIEHLLTGSWITSPRLENAMRAGPRHLFLPRAPLEEAYADQNVATKTDPSGAVLSSASTPSIVAMVLEEAGIRRHTLGVAVKDAPHLPQYPPQSIRRAYP